MADGDEHFTRCNPPKSVLVRRGSYQDACTEGFKSTTKRHSEVHHIVCEVAMKFRKDAYPSGSESFIEDCLTAVEWDINNPDNLVGLPRNRRFREAYKGESSDWQPRDWPSHHVDHNTKGGYSDQVGDWLKDNLWSQVEAGADKHLTTVAAIKKQLEACTTQFKKKLVARKDSYAGGTVAGWRDRFEADQARAWYKPFSMITKPSHRSPGSKTKALTGVFAKLR